MTVKLEGALKKLVTALAVEPGVRAIGLSGGDRPLPEPGCGDLDLFVYARRLPHDERRLAALRSLDGLADQIELARLAGGPWGIADHFMLLGVDTWVMGFSLAEARAELEAILSGNLPDRQEDGYYPIGRCATWKSMRVLYDPDGFLTELQSRLEVYPEALARRLIECHLEAGMDLEDLERAVRRKDLLFYHFALDLALDHFLQALFALNLEYFPGRKRSQEYLEQFRLKPADCVARVWEVVRLGGNADTLAESYKQWQCLVCDLTLLA